MTDAALNSVATLIVKPAGGEPGAAAARVAQALAREGGKIGETIRLGRDACEILFDGLPLPHARAAVKAAIGDRPVDVAVQPAAGRRKRLLVADMDSTIIKVECIDELADFAGIRTKVAAITEAAMRGDLDFAAALRKRVALLAGLPIEILDRCYAERVEPTAGARVLVKTMSAAGARTVLVSGGFTFFTQRVARALGFDRHVANRLEHAEGRLTGTVAPPLVTAETKLETLLDECHRHQIAAHEVLAVGDGANDIPMLGAAGLAVAFHAKPQTEAAAGAAIRHGDLRALLYLQGYAESEFVDA